LSSTATPGATRHPHLRPPLAGALQGVTFFEHTRRLLESIEHKSDVKEFGGSPF
jgi:hypothetical protein